MTQVSDAMINTMINSIPDKKQRDQMKKMLFNKVTHKVLCMSEECEGRHIANINNDGSVSLVASEGKSWLRASRNRLDSAMGFQCWCGNDSRLSKQEMLVPEMNQSAVDKNVVRRVLALVNDDPSNYPVVNGSQSVDGFVIEEVK